MVFAAETVTVAAHGLGPIQLFTGATPLLVGRVVSFSIELGDGTWHEIRGGSPDQVVDLFEASAPSGNIQVTMDEVQDIDAATLVGKRANVVLQQELPLASAKKWTYTAATAVIKPGTMAGDRTGTTDTTQTFTIMPYAAVGSPTYVFVSSAGT